MNIAPAEEHYVFEWVNRDGTRKSLASLAEANYGTFKLSPDGRFLAYELLVGEQWDIWIHDIEPGVSDRLAG